MGERRFCYRCMEKYDSDQHICPHCGFDDTTAHNPMYIAPGTVLRDRYLIGILLEYNGEGATYVGHDISTGCKVLLREYMPINLCTRVKNRATISVNYNNLAKYKAFMAEYTELNKSLARLRNNSNINPVLDMFAENNTTYTVFEYIEGVKMLDYLKDNAGEISWDQVSKLFPPLFTTIGILHNAGIIHRAISPDTVYITDKGELKLSGFCVSAVRTANAGLEYELFKGYAAPEQYSASSSSRQGSWTDVYGVCALLYRALTGCMPVDSVSRMKHDDLCEPSMLNNSIPPHVSRVIMEGMNLNGRDRIQTITELVTRLFEQPAPVRAAYNSEPPIHHEVNHQYNEPPKPVQQPYHQAPPPVQQNHYNDQYKPQNQPRYYNEPADDYDEYSYEKVNTVDRIKVPIIIGILLLAILLILVVFIVKAFVPANNDDESDFSRPSSSISENIVTGETEATTVAETKPDTDMPDLVGKFFSLTEKKYEDYFKFEAEYEYNNDHEADVIFEQDIKPGTNVAQGCTVKLKVSKGKEGADIPDYNGLTVSQYENRLKEAGITNFSLVVSSNGWGTPNTVAQLQVDGKQVNVGSFYSNKDGKKLIVYYYPENAQGVPETTQAYTEYQQQYETTAAPVVTTEAPVYTEPATQAPVVTEPVVTDQPNPGEFGHEEGVDEW
ncbi:MAG: PASTA domain-containing protein [Ruminococcus sp.]|nr:PASTA domain-containing protein [Ruminococcus sp.]